MDSLTRILRRHPILSAIVAVLGSIVTLYLLVCQVWATVSNEPLVPVIARNTKGILPSVEAWFAILVWAVASAILIGLLAYLVYLVRKGSPPSQEPEPEEENPPDIRVTRERLIIEYRNHYGKGVHLRNQGSRIPSDQQLELWMNDVRAWTDDVIQSAYSASPADGALIETLDRMPAIPFPDALNEEHLRQMRMLERRLQLIRQVLRSGSLLLRLTDQLRNHFASGHFA